MDRAFLAVLAALVLAPSATAQLGISNPDSGAATLHFHLMDIQDFAINTQPMQFLWSGEPGTGLAAHTLSCAPEVPAVNVAQDWHTNYGYSTASYVEYDVTQDGRPRLWPERQLGYNLTLDAGVPPVLRWYLATQTGMPPAGPVDSDAAPVPLANVVVEATLRVPDPISVDDKAYNTGPVIAHGRSAPALLAADFSQGVEHSMVGDRHVYGFSVPLSIEQAFVGDAGYTLRIDVFLDNPACGDPSGGTVMPNFVAPFADPDHRPGLTTGALEPLRILSLEPQFIGKDVVVHGVVSSVWGNYDVDEGNLTLEVEGPNGTFELQPVTLVQTYHAHEHHADPVEVTWLWNRTDAADGLYLLTWNVSNDQHSATARATAAVRLGAGEAVFGAAAGEVPPARAMPSGAPFGLVFAVVATAFLLRRRGRQTPA